MNISHEQRLNMLAIELLEQQGHIEPTQQQIDRMEEYLQHMQEIDDIYVCTRSKKMATA